jgi:hypothetical protein
MYLSGRRNKNFDYECYSYVRKLPGRSSWQVLARQSDTVLGLDSRFRLATRLNLQSLSPITKYIPGITPSMMYGEGTMASTCDKRPSA